MSSTEVGEYLTKTYGATVLNMTAVNSKVESKKAVDQLLAMVLSGDNIVVIEGEHVEQVKQVKQVKLTSNMLAFYHPSNMGKKKGMITFLTNIYFDPSTEWYKYELVPSGIPYPHQAFTLISMPEDDSMGVYELAGSYTGTLNIRGNKPIISTRTPPRTKR